MIMGRPFKVAAHIFALAMIFTGCRAVEEYLPTAREAVPDQVAGAVKDAIDTAAEKVVEAAAESIVEPTPEMDQGSAAADAPPTGISIVTLEPVMSIPTAPAPVAAPTMVPTVVVLPATATPVPPLAFINLNSGTTQRLTDVAWNPNGSYALVTGNGGTLLRYDGASFTSIESGTNLDLFSVSWNPAGDKAVITGGKGNSKALVMTYDGNVLTTVASGAGPNLNGSMWAPDGSYAMIVGYNGFIQRLDDSGLTNMDPPWGHYSGVAFNHDGSLALVTNTNAPFTTVLEFNGESFSEPIPTGVPSNLQDMAWKSDGSYGLVVGSGGAIFKYDDSGFTGLNNEVKEALYAVDWRAGGEQALMVGGVSPFDFGQEEKGVVLAFDGKEVRVLETGLNVNKALFGLEWTPDGEYALMVGEGGTAIRYHPSTPAVVLPNTVLDQDHSPVQYAFGQGFGSYDVGQSFIPDSPVLTAAGLPVCTGSEAAEISVQVRRGAYDGPLVAERVRTLDVPFCGFGEERFTRFDFDHPVDVTPGETYVIRIHSTAPSSAAVFGTIDQYPSGHFFRFDHGEPVPGQDMGFRTYAVEVPN